MNYIAPGKKENIEKSVEKDVNKYLKNWENKLGNLKNKKYYAWAISDKNRFKSYTFNNGEYIGIYETNNNSEKTKFYKGKSKLFIESRELSEEIWGKGVEKNRVIIFEKLGEFETTKKEIYEKFNGGKVLQSIKRTSIDIKKVKLKEIADDNEEEKLNIEKDNKITKIKIEKRLGEINNGRFIDIKYKELNSKSLKKNNTLVKKGKRKQEENIGYPRKELGLLGEILVFNKINSEIEGLSETILIDKLHIDKDKIKSIEFYNKDGLSNYNNFEDKSIEKGCDIKIMINDGIEVDLEVKSSKYVVNKITLTFNELLNMKNNENSYIVLVHRVLEDPEITIIKNFYKLYNDNIMKFIIKQEIDISQIPNEYKI
ncbi:protein NO VEIN domain-containing protein [Clostridium isatidis]|uniref:protein NO VEIN domain-containing protein n=1 Tax=Clostridium isatidis TaxID=182773 RepID=UPI003AAFD5E3